MSQVRFATVRALHESFPEALANIGAAPSEEHPVAFLRRLAAARQFDRAISVCAYLLPRREAVWWGCLSARILLGETMPVDTAPLAAAEAWAKQPSDGNRQVALDIGSRADRNAPLTWLALGAGWSSGNFAPTPVPVPPFMTARAVRAALLVALRAVPVAELPGRLQACVMEGIRIAEEGP